MLKGVPVIRVASIAVCAGALFVWARSQSVCDLVWYGGDTHETGAMFSRRAVYFYHEQAIGAHRLTPPRGFGHATQAAFDEYRPPRVVLDRGEGDFGVIHGDNGRTKQWIVTAPYWFVVAATALPAALVTIHIRRKRSAKAVVRDERSP